MTVRVLARKKSLRKGGKRAGSRVAYMFDMAEAERPDFRCARIDPSRPLRQYVGGAAYYVKIGGFQHLKSEKEFQGPFTISLSCAREKVGLRTEYPIGQHWHGVQSRDPALLNCRDIERPVFLCMESLRQFLDKHIIAKTGLMS